MIPFPPFAKQREIVRRVESLFTLSARIASRLKRTQARVERLTQSLLAKAFRGELIPRSAPAKAVTVNPPPRCPLASRPRAGEPSPQ
jgi:restriction endonuclease S subunit